MDFVEIEWSSKMINMDNIQLSMNTFLDHYGFYLILTGQLYPTRKKICNLILQYIGKAYDQTIRARVSQDHIAYKTITSYLKKHTGYSVFVKPGVIVDCSKKRITNEIVSDIEACLIYYNKPPANKMNKESYSGRELFITNSGKFSPLGEVIFSKEFQ